ncbi:MAG: endolytic transglycosylase MltG [Polyangiales bacterium]
MGRAVDVEVPRSASDAQIVARLEASGVIDHPRLFAVMLKVLGGAQAKSGNHFLTDDLSPLEVLRRLRRSPSAEHVRVTIPEGFNRFDIARRLREKRVCDDAAFLEATENETLLDALGISANAGNSPQSAQSTQSTQSPNSEFASAEGWLFPATYTLPTDADADDVVRRTVEAGKARLDRLLLAHPDAASELQRSLGFGLREIVTLASVIEKEAGVDDERPLIASVFLNRLREPSATASKLQADPTAMYGCQMMRTKSSACLAWLAAGGKPTPEIQHDPSNAWSTYSHPGLPPTPIANPGERSLEAVLSPAKTRYFYFVAKGAGRHSFSETLTEHNRAMGR